MTNKNTQKAIEINITNITTIKANGIHTNGNCKSILDLTTGNVYTSMTDTAAALGCSIDAVSNTINNRQKTCKGHELCLLSKANEYVPQMAEQISTMHKDLSELEQLKAKAKAYDQLMAEQERKRKEEEARLERERKAEEKRQAKISKLEDKVERLETLIDRKDKERQKLVDKRNKALVELQALNNGKEEE